MANAKTKDMTKGNITKALLMFALPILVGDLFQQLYCVVDSIIVGRLLGVNALAAVGATGSLTFMVIGFVQGIATGFSVITSQEFGAFSAKLTTEDSIRKSIWTSTILGAVITVVITAASLLASRSMLGLMNTPDDIIEDSNLYLSIIFGGIFATMYFNIMAARLRALGDSRTPLVFLIVSSILNIVLDILFIAVFDMNVDGAAYATVLSQLISAIGCHIYSVRNFNILKYRLKDVKTDFAQCRRHLKTGLPMALQFSVTAVGVMIMQRHLNGFGAVAIAGFTASSRIQSIMCSGFYDFAISLSTFCGQNLGAGEFDRIRKGVFKVLWMGLLLCLVTISILWAFGRQLTTLFSTEATEELIAYSYDYMKIASVFYPLLHILVMYRNALQGLGKAFVPFLGGVIELSTRAAFTALLTRKLGYYGVCLADPIAWILSSLVLALTYVHWVQKTKRTGLKPIA